VGSRAGARPPGDTETQTPGGQCCRGDHHPPSDRQQSLARRGAGLRAALAAGKGGDRRDAGVGPRSLSHAQPERATPGAADASDARRKGEEAVDQVKQAYGKLITITEQTQAQAEKVCTMLRVRSEYPSQRLVEQVKRFLHRIEQGVRQSVRRVIGSEVVPATEKILSLFEPYTRVTVCHKGDKPGEFGRKLWLEEAEGGSSAAIASSTSLGRTTPTSNRPSRIIAGGSVIRCGCS
jgi:hypothetical protein